MRELRAKAAMVKSSACPRESFVSPRDIIVNWFVLWSMNMPDAPSWALRRQLRGEERREKKDRSIECWAPKHTIQAEQYTKTSLHGNMQYTSSLGGNIERVRAKKKCLQLTLRESALVCGRVKGEGS